MAHLARGILGELDVGKATVVEELVLGVRSHRSARPLGALSVQPAVGQSDRPGGVLVDPIDPGEALEHVPGELDRIGASFGYGQHFGRLSTDFAFMYVALDERTTTTNAENFNGVYETRIALLGVTLGW